MDNFIKDRQIGYHGESRIRNNPPRFDLAGNPHQVEAIAFTRRSCGLNLLNKDLATLLATTIHLACHLVTRDKKTESSGFFRVRVGFRHRNRMRFWGPIHLNPLIPDLLLEYRSNRPLLTIEKEILCQTDRVVINVCLLSEFFDLTTFSIKLGPGGPEFVPAHDSIPSLKVHKKRYEDISPSHLTRWVKTPKRRSTDQNRQKSSQKSKSAEPAEYSFRKVKMRFSTVYQVRFILRRTATLVNL